VSGDAGRLKQVVWNLLTNAIKFTSPKGIIEVTLNELTSEHKVRICIRDTGKGISAEFLPHIFKLFTQADSSSVRVHGGLGIGLALVHSLVKLQGGDIKAESPGEGKGSTFTVTLPLRSEKNAVEPVTKKHSSNALDHFSLSGLRILLVDDDEATLRSTQQVLCSFGAEVRWVLSTSEAIDEFKKARPDLIVSDIGMPIRDGYSLIREIRGLKVEEGGNTPALALTAYADAQSRDLALQAGYQAHRAKPIDSEDLVRTILKLQRN
jgi:CheY-like chemotaxis protein/anti-sigma regulatory factor (Ser/Thr protein kinase)